MNGLEQGSSRLELIETHISWVILTDQLAYKIKKPITYSFLDFSSLEKRLFYCTREVELNQRLEQDLYIGVRPVRIMNSTFTVGEEGTIVDYAVEMKRVDHKKQMDVLLREKKITNEDILVLAGKVARFHNSATILHNVDILSIREKFNDLSSQKQFLRDSSDNENELIVTRAIATSNNFIERNSSAFQLRLEKGYVRDCHGDLHSKNIFFLPQPVIFDCIEFNDDYRQIDVLNEVAFLCMDLDASGRSDLADIFIQAYNRIFPAMKTEDDNHLFLYYKCYRANIRAKVNCLRAQSATDKESQHKALSDASLYLKLLEHYIQRLQLT